MCVKMIIDQTQNYFTLPKILVQYIYYNIFTMLFDYL